MSYLVANLPPIQCYIRKEYLYDFQKGFGEFEPCYWVSVKSIKGKALYIESLLVNYGALYDKLPISAYVPPEPVPAAAALHHAVLHKARRDRALLRPIDLVPGAEPKIVQQVLSCERGQVCGARGTFG